MKLEGRQLKSITLAVAVLLSVVTTARSQAFALLTLSNAIPTNVPALQIPQQQNVELGANQAVPLIEMLDVPISTGIENLARQANINYLVDTRLAKWWSFPDSDGYATHEPTLNFRWKNLGAKEALLRVLGEHHLVLAEDPLTTVTRITYTNQIVNSIDVSLLGSDTNVIPVIQLQEVPITSCLKNLARLAGVNYILDPRIGYGSPDKQGQIKPEPVLSLRWENVTAKQGLIAIFENYDFIIVKDPTTSIVLIRTKDHPVANFVDASFLGGETNAIPLIQFQEVPITTALENLARQADINYVLDPQVGYGKPDKHGQIKIEPLLFLRWENVTAQQALIALCENYDLVIVKDVVTGVITIKPSD
jgi:hypothetical protein